MGEEEIFICSTACVCVRWLDRASGRRRSNGVLMAVACSTFEVLLWGRATHTCFDDEE